MSNLLAIFILVIIGGLVAKAFVGATVISARELAIWFRLKRSGKRGEAIIEALYIKTSRGQDYYIVFRPLAEQIVSVTQFINWRSYKRFQKRESVTVTYLPNLPDIARLSGEDDVSWGRGLPTVLAMVFIFLFPPLAMLWLLIFGVVYFAPHITIHPIFSRILTPDYPTTKSKRSR